MLPQNDPDSKKNTTANAEGDTAASTPATDAKTATSTTEFEKSFSAAVAKHDRQAMNQIRTEYLLSACRATQGELDLTAKEEKITFPDRDDIEQYRFPTNDQYITALNANKQLTTLTLHSLHYGLGESFIRLLPLANRTQWITQLKIARCRPSEDDLKALSTMQEKYNPDSKFSCIDIDASYRESVQVLEVFSRCKSLTSLVIRVPGYLREDHNTVFEKTIAFLNNISSIHSLKVIMVNSNVEQEQIVNFITKLKFIEDLEITPCDINQVSQYMIINAVRDNNRLMQLDVVDPDSKEDSIPDGNSDFAKKVRALLALNKYCRPRSVVDWQDAAFAVAFSRANIGSSLVNSFLSLMPNVRSLLPSSARKGNPKDIFALIKGLFPPEVEDQVNEMKMEVKKGEWPEIIISHCSQEVMEGMYVIGKLGSHFPACFILHSVFFDDPNAKITITQPEEFQANLLQAVEVPVEEEIIDEKTEKTHRVDQEFKRLKSLINERIKSFYRETIDAILYKKDEKGVSVGSFLPNYNELVKKFDEVKSKDTLADY